MLARRTEPKAWAVLLFALLAACQSPGPSGPITEMDKALDPAATASAPPVPADVSNALIPGLKPPAPGLAPRRAEEPRFDIAVNELPAQQFFMGLVDGTRYNMVVHPEVNGNITLNLRNVTIDDVVNAARDVYGFEFERTAYGFQVLPARLGARVFQINYLNMQRSGASSTFVSAGTLQGSGSENGGGGGQGRSQGGNQDSNSEGSSGNGGSGGEENRAVVGTEVKTVAPQTSFWQELLAALNTIVGAAEGRSVVVSPQSGVVVVRAMPHELREVESYLKAAQLIAERQVILEAKVLEVELSDGFQSGINWAAVIDKVSLGQTGGGTVFDNTSGLSNLSGQSIPLRPGVPPVSGLPASAFGGVFSLAVHDDNFAGFVELLKSQGNVQVLSSPRISSMNNQKAIIKVGTDEFFVTDVSTTTVTGTATTSTPNIELTPFFSGIALDVTPQISSDGIVTLHIHPSVSEVTDQQKRISIAGVEQTLPLARSSVRESDSVVRARSGQLVVIGGLMQTKVQDQNARMPGLGDVPAVGGLFRQTKNRSVKSELVILLRPLVIDSAEDWSRAVDDSRQRIRGLGGEIERDTLLPGGSSNPR
jgi:MSHA biogenesis protein MshL